MKSGSKNFCVTTLGVARDKKWTMRLSLYPRTDSNGPNWMKSMYKMDHPLKIP
jgi:hypothetical protein